MVCVTSKASESPSLGSLISLRGEARRERLMDGTLRVTFEVIKDKRRGPGFRRVEECDGPAGLC
ncbi:MAG: recombination protein RecA [Myxococcota bacterium]